MTEPTQQRFEEALVLLKSAVTAAGDRCGDRCQALIPPVDLADLPFPDARCDAVLCSAVLHFARDEAHFDRMLSELWRVLRQGGLFFARLATTIGMAGRVQPLDGHWYLLPDGTRRFLVDEEKLRKATGRLGGTRLDPLKTTLVEDLRAMTTWVLRKPR